VGAQVGDGLALHEQDAAGLDRALRDRDRRAWRRSSGERIDQLPFGGPTGPSGRSSASRPADDGRLSKPAPSPPIGQHKPAADRAGQRDAVFPIRSQPCWSRPLPPRTSTRPIVSLSQRNDKFRPARAVDTASSADHDPHSRFRART